MGVPEHDGLCLPNFLIIGAARCGTTTLYNNLAEHPEVYLPPKRPEPHFFLRESEYAKGLEYYARRYFASVNGERAIGEASTSYIISERAAQRIARDLPDVRLILMLRHPIERAFSGYWHTRESGLETLSFEEAVAREFEREAAETDPKLRENRPYAYVSRSLYFAQLSAYLAYFPAERIQVILFEDFVRAPAATFVAVCRFLGVDGQFRSTTLGQVSNAATPQAATIEPALRARLAEILQPDVLQLGRLLNRDLSDWMH